MKNLTGKSFGHFQILEKIGEGGLASIYKAYDSPQNRVLAIKMVFPYFEPSKVLYKRFMDEGEMLKKLNHPNIVRVLEVGESEGKPYLAMEYISGGTLKHLMKKPMPWQDAVSLLSPIARALEYIHSHGVIHGDVKPSNILITESGEPLLSDFGLAQIGNDSIEGVLSPSNGVGTPAYMAPEQFQGQTVDFRADIYALGTVLYEMVTGRKPYVADTPMAIIIKKMTEPLPKPSKFVNNLPDELENILLRALAKEPKNRYRDITAFADSVEKLIDPKHKFKFTQNKANRKLRIFLCHSSEDKPSVRKLYEKLTMDGFDAWLDEEKLLPGQNWDLEIKKAVRETDIVIICLSKKSISKEGYIQKEIRIALDIADEKPEGAIFLIPARLEVCDVPSRLSMWQWVDIFKERGYEKLLRSLQVRSDVLEAQIFSGY